MLRRATPRTPRSSRASVSPRLLVVAKNAPRWETRTLTEPSAPPPGPAGPPGADAFTAFAVVSADGHLLAHKGVTSVFWNGGGQYQVEFAQSMANCAEAATAVTGPGPTLAGGAARGLAFVEEVDS